MTKIILEGEVDYTNIEVEDGGCAVIVEPEWKVSGGDENIFVRIQSWDEDIYDNPLYDPKDSREDRMKLGHKSIQELFGKKIRVTIEVVED